MAHKIRTPILHRTSLNYLCIVYLYKHVTASGTDIDCTICLIPE